jgi:hypothetical protein
VNREGDKMNFWRVILFAFVGLATVAWAYDVGDHRDGNFWREMSVNQKAVYVAGFLDGMEEAEGHELDDVLALMKTLPKSVKTGQQWDILEARATALEPLSNIKIGQLEDGLNQFYSDYRNRMIHIGHALLLVAESIKGMSAEKVEEHSAQYREKDSK